MQSPSPYPQKPHIPQTHVPLAPVQRPVRPNSLKSILAKLRLPNLPFYVWAILGGAVFSAAIIGMCMVLALFAVGSLYASGKILPGVTVADKTMSPVNVGGAAISDAASQLNVIVPDAKITFHDDKRSFTLSASDFGLRVDGQATANAAAQVGRASSSLTDGVSVMLHGTQITPIYTIDLAKAASALKGLSASTNTAATPEVPGRTLNVNATIDRMPSDLGFLLKKPEVTLVMDVVQGPHTNYTVLRGEELGIISKKFNVSVQAIADLNHITNTDTIYPGQTLMIPAAGVWSPTEKDAPPAPLSKGKAIVVSVLNQRIYAYEDGHLVHSSLMSSGRVGHETVNGDYHIYQKLVTTRMTGPDYDIPDVPWTMYFYAGYGIHGAYWHNDFGRVMSHGCVNLDTDEAKWFFDWAPMGTLVRVLPNWTSPTAG